MTFAEFASLCYALEETPSRLAKIASAAAYLKRLQPGEIRYGVAFLSGRPFPVSDPRTLDIGPSALFEASKIPAPPRIYLQLHSPLKMSRTVSAESPKPAAKAPAKKN